MDISAIAIQGLQQADAQLSNAAVQIATYGADNAAPADTVDLSAAMVALASAKIDFAANVKALQTADQIAKNVIDLQA